MEETVGALVLAESIREFHKTKELGDKALAQVADADLGRVHHPEGNSLVLLIQHLAGNMRSRWTDFLTTDGEKPDRDRDREFELAGGVSRAELLARWEAGWALVFSALAALTEDDLGREIAIRAEPHTVVRAIHRQLTHYAYHVGQMVMLAKALRDAEWQTLSVPKGGSKAFNTAKFGSAEEAKA
jgi:hypothetical protein